MKRSDLLKRKVEYTKAVLHSKYDDGKKAVVRVRYDGLNYWITKRALRSAERRARLISGDYFRLPERLFIEQE